MVRPALAILALQVQRLSENARQEPRPAQTDSGVRVREEVLPTAEICDGKDNNCDGSKDEGCKFSCGLKQEAGSTVNMASSDLEHSQTLFSIANSALPLGFELTYNSLGRGGP